MAALAGTAQLSCPITLYQHRQSSTFPTSFDHKRARRHLHQRPAQKSQQQPPLPSGLPVFDKVKEKPVLSISAIIPKGFPTGQDTDGRVLPDNNVARAYIHNMLHGLSACASLLCAANDLSMEHLPQPFTEVLLKQTIVVHFSCTEAMAALLTALAAPNGSVLPMASPIGDFSVLLQSGKNQPQAREYAASNLPPTYTDATVVAMLSKLGMHVTRFARQTAFQPAPSAASHGIHPLPHGSRAIVTVSGPRFPRTAEPMQVAGALLTLRFHSQPPRHLLPGLRVPTPAVAGGMTPEMTAAMVQAACAAVPDAAPVLAAPACAAISAALAGTRAAPSATTPTIAAGASHTAAAILAGGASSSRMTPETAAAVAQAACAAVPGATPVSAAANSGPACAAASAALAGARAGPQKPAPAAATGPLRAVAAAPAASSDAAPAGAPADAAGAVNVTATVDARAPATPMLASCQTRGTPAGAAVLRAPADPGGVAIGTPAVPHAVVHADPLHQRCPSPRSGESAPDTRAAVGPTSMQCDAPTASAQPMEVTAQHKQPQQPAAAARQPKKPALAAAKRAMKPTLHRQRGPPAVPAEPGGVSARQLAAVQAATNGAAGALIESFNSTMTSDEARAVIGDRLSSHVHHLPLDISPDGDTVQALRKYASRVTTVLTHIREVQRVDHECVSTVGTHWGSFVSAVATALEDSCADFDLSKLDHALLRLEGRVSAAVRSFLAPSPSSGAPCPPLHPRPSSPHDPPPGPLASLLSTEDFPPLPPLYQPATPSLTLLLTASPIPACMRPEHCLSAVASQSLTLGLDDMCVDTAVVSDRAPSDPVLHNPRCHPCRQGARGGVEGTSGDGVTSGSCQHQLQTEPRAQVVVATALPDQLPQLPNHCAPALAAGAPTSDEALPAALPMDQTLTGYGMLELALRRTPGDGLSPEERDLAVCAAQALHFAASDTSSDGYGDYGASSEDDSAPVAPRPAVQPAAPPAHPGPPSDA